MFPDHPSVFVDAKEANPMELGQLRQQYAEQWDCIDEEVSSIILGVETGQEVDYNRRDAEEFAGRGKLKPEVHLFPACK